MPYALGVGVQRLVEHDTRAGARSCFECTRHAVAPELQAVTAGQLGRLDDAAVRHRDLRAGRDIHARFDDAVVAERDTDARVRTDEAPASDGDDLAAAT